MRRFRSLADINSIFLILTILVCMLLMTCVSHATSWNSIGSILDKHKTGQFIYVFNKFLNDDNLIVAPMMSAEWNALYGGLIDVSKDKIIIPTYGRYYQRKHNSTATATPEPATLVLLTSGLLGLVAIKRRFRG